MSDKKQRQEYDFTRPQEQEGDGIYFAFFVLLSLASVLAIMIYIGSGVDFGSLLSDNVVEDCNVSFMVLECDGEEFHVEANNLSIGMDIASTVRTLDEILNNSCIVISTVCVGVNKSEEE